MPVIYQVAPAFSGRKTVPDADLIVLEVVHSLRVPVSVSLPAPNNHSILNPRSFVEVIAPPLVGPVTVITFFSQVLAESIV